MLVRKRVCLLVSMVSTICFGNHSSIEDSQNNWANFPCLVGVDLRQFFDQDAFLRCLAPAPVLTYIPVFFLCVRRDYRRVIPSQLLATRRASAIVNTCQIYLSIKIHIMRYYEILWDIMSIYIYISIYPSIYPSIHPSIYLSIYIPIIGISTMGCMTIPHHSHVLIVADMSPNYIPETCWTIFSYFICIFYTYI